MKALTPFLIIGICVGMYFLYMGPVITEIKDLQAKKDEYTNVLNKVKEIKDRRDAVSAEYNNISPENFERLNKIIPKKFDSVVFVNDVNNIASRNGVILKSYKENGSSSASSETTTTEAPEAIYRTNIIIMNFVGPYKQFLSFLSELETSLQLVDVITLDILSSSGVKLADNQYQYTLEVNVYSLR